MVSIKYCPKRCCRIRIGSFSKAHWYGKNRKKCGIVLYCPVYNRVLVVQSRGWKWGFPKGSIEADDKTPLECALRELHEETGILLTEEFVKQNLQKVSHINKATYFYVHTDTVPRYILTNRSDASGISWIHPECLADLANTRKVYINAPCRRLLNTLFGLKVL